MFGPILWRQKSYIRWLQISDGCPKEDAFHFIVQCMNSPLLDALVTLAEPLLYIDWNGEILSMMLNRTGNLNPFIRSKIQFTNVLPHGLHFSISFDQIDIRIVRTSGTYYASIQE